MQFEQNTEDPNSVIANTGKMIQNFGVVEYISLRWIGVLTGNEDAVNIAMELTLATRIKVVVKLIETKNKFNENTKSSALKLWKELLNDGLPKRNIVAHGMLVTKKDINGAILNQGPLKIKKWTDSDELMTHEELANTVTVTKNIIVELEKILKCV